VFFDDYANCLVVGNAMGPLCDRFKISRAKLAYIVDSTAAPVASLALVSTWVGYEVGLIEEALIKAGSDTSAFALFVEALPYRFYSIFTLFFVGAVALTGRDYGPMLVAEAEARANPEDTEAAAAADRGTHFALAAVPVLTLVLLTFTLLVLDGRSKLGDAAAGAPLFKVLGEADPYLSMFLGGLAAFLVASAMSLGMKVLEPKPLADAAWSSAKAVVEALAVLYLAWVLGDAIEHAGAADFLASVLSGRMEPWMLPSAVFLLSAGTAFSTGTSFGTMAILIPLAVPLGVSMGGPDGGPILLGATAAVLAGSCLGDHASPISDTTVLSALGSGVDLVTHVRTQLPYAMTTGLISIFVG
jgi:Na+/H+ antiporter NhaC